MAKKKGIQGRAKPMMKYLPVNIDSFDPTARQLLIAKRYLRVVNTLSYTYKPVLKVGNQTFDFGGGDDTQEEVSWMCWQLAKALSVIVEETP